MEDEIHKIYQKVSNKCSEEEFLAKIDEFREKEKDNPFVNEINLADLAYNFFKDSEEEVQHFTNENANEKIADFEPGQTEKNVIGRVMLIGNPKGFTRKGKPGRVCNINIEDDTGSLKVTLWSENIKLLKNISEGEIIQINNVDIKEGFRGGIEATCKPRSTMIHLNEEDYPNFPKYKEDITNIEDISPETDVNIIARIFKIPNIRTYEKNGKEGQVVSIVLQDATGKISYTLWNKNTDLIKTMELNEGDTVKILNAKARERNGEISLTHWDGRIIKEEFDVPECSEKIDSIIEVQDNKDVSVIGIITKIQDPIIFTKKDGSEGKVRSIEIKDDTGSVKITLWNQDAEMELNKGDIIKISGGNGEFDDYSSSGYRINTNWNSSFIINPEIDSPLMDLLKEYKEEIGPISLSQVQEIDDDGIEVDVIGRVISISDLNEFQRDDGNVGLVRSVDFSDGTGIVQLSFWGERAQEHYETGEAYRIENARTKMGMYAVDLNVGRTSRIFKLSEEEANFLPSFETIQKSVFDFKSITDIDEDDINIIVVARIIESSEVHEFERNDGSTGYVKNLDIVDNSGAIRLTLWDQNAKLDYELGKAIKIQNPSIRFNEDHLELSLNRNSAILDPSESEIVSLPSYDELKANMYQNKTIEELEDDDTNVIITGQLRDPYGNKVILTKCPFCSNTLEFTGDDEYICDFCGEVVEEPKYLLMIPCKIEDETGEISVTFFDKLAEELLEMKKEDIVGIIEDSEDIGALEGKVEDLNGLTLEIVANVSFDEYNEENRLRPKKILNKYY